MLMTLLMMMKWVTNTHVHMYIYTPLTCNLMEARMTHQCTVAPVQHPQIYVCTVSMNNCYLSPPLLLLFPLSLSGWREGDRCVHTYVAWMFLWLTYLLRWKTSKFGITSFEVRGYFLRMSKHRSVNPKNFAPGSAASPRRVKEDRVCPLNISNNPLPVVLAELSHNSR